MKAVALRLAPQRMEIEAGDIEVAQRRSLFQRIQSPKRSALEVRCHFWALTFVKQVLEPLVAEAPYHRTSVTSSATRVNRFVTGRVSGRRGPSAGRYRMD
jgi:hypothetical protein